MDLIMSVKDSFQVEEKIKTAIYGVASIDSRENESFSQLIGEDVNTNRSNSIEIVKSFNVIKSLIWACSRTLNNLGEEVEREE